MRNAIITLIAAAILLALMFYAPDGFNMFVPQDEYRHGSELIPTAQWFGGPSPQLLERKSGPTFALPTLTPGSTMD